MSKTQVNRRQEWLLNIPQEGFNKESLFDSYVLYFFDKCFSIFDIKGLPKSMSKHNILRLLFSYGWCVVPNEKIKENIYAFTGGLGGVYNAYYEPTQVVISNPYLNFDKTLTIQDDKDAVLIRNDTYLMGLYPLINKYATIMTECDLSLRLGVINTRKVNTFVADTQSVKDAFDNYNKAVEDGIQPSAIVSNAFLQGQDGLKDVQQPVRVSNLKDLIELKQYCVASLWNEIGVNANYNMKRESINESESGLNEQALIPFIQDMLNNLKEGFKKVNEIHNLNISVELSPMWKTTFEQVVEDSKAEQEEVKEDVKNEV
jgi:hypothetical protein